MRLDLNFEFSNVELLNLPKDAEVMEDAIHAGKILANLLATSNESENPLKFFDWALDLYKKKAIDIDKSDLDILRKFVKQHPKLAVFAKAQILNKLSNLVDEDLKKA